MNDSKQYLVLIVGNAKTYEMSTVLDDIGEVCHRANISSVASLTAISKKVECPDLIVICQNWPDEFTRQDLKLLLKRFPISRLVCCYGVWCESDGRTRSVWPLSIRVPARCSRARIEHEWGIVLTKRNAFPLTAGRDEIFQLEESIATDTLEQNGNSPLIKISSGDTSYLTMLEEIIVSWGGRITKQSQKEEPDLLIVDLDPWEMVLSERIDLVTTAPRIGMMGLAHTETIESARLLGFEAIVCKVAPDLILFQTITRLLGIKVFPQEVH